MLYSLWRCPMAIQAIRLYVAIVEKDTVEGQLDIVGARYKYEKSYKGKDVGTIIEEMIKNLKQAE
jgi:hypothetical protein